MYKGEETDHAHRKESRNRNDDRVQISPLAKCMSRRPDDPVEEKLKSEGDDEERHYFVWFWSAEIIFDFFKLRVNRPAEINKNSQEWREKKKFQYEIDDSLCCIRHPSESQKEAFDKEREELSVECIKCEKAGSLRQPPQKS